MAKPKKHLFICTNQRPEGHPRGCCASREALKLWQKFGDLLNEKGLFNEVHFSGVRSCLGPCSVGPVIVVYPDNVWYGNVTEADVEEILTDHIVGGNPVQRLVIPDEMFA